MSINILLLTSIELNQFTTAETLASDFVVQAHHKTERRNIRRQTTHKIKLICKCGIFLTVT